MQIVKTGFLVFVLSIAAGSSAAEQPIDWRARLLELGEAESREVVMTAFGDALWMQPISGVERADLQSIFQLTRAADVAYMNLEIPLPEQGFPVDPGRQSFAGYKKKVVMADPSMINEYVWAGIDVVATANNHMMDYGSAGLESTVRLLEEHDIKHSGAGRDVQEALSATYLDSKGISFAFLSFMVGSPRERPSLVAPADIELSGVAPVRGSTFRSSGGDVEIAPWQSDLVAMEAAIREANERADVVVVSYHIHWGDRDEVTTGKRTIARAAVDAGADMIIGHGPHVLNGIELYRGVPILYSISHFFFQVPIPAYQMFPGVQDDLQNNYYADERLYESVLVRAIFNERAKLKRLELLPVEVSAEGGEPFFAAGTMSERILQRLQSMSHSLGTTITRESWYGVVKLD